MFDLQVSGSYSKSEAYLRSLLKLPILDILKKFGQEGVDALSRGTPVDSGLAANSWRFEATQRGSVYELVWSNSDVENGFPVAIMLRYGYATGTGGYVQGRDYITPAIEPIFDRIKNEVWKAVTSA